MYFQYWQSSANYEWYWRLRAPNHKIIAVSSEGYRYEQDCIHSINLVKGTTTATPVQKTTA